jgi:hypothetical protein
MLGVHLNSHGALPKTKLLKIMNVNGLNVHKITLFLCLHNSFLKKLTLQCYSACSPT